MNEREDDNENVMSFKGEPIAHLSIFFIHCVLEMENFQSFRTFLEHFMINLGEMWVAEYMTKSKQTEPIVFDWELKFVFGKTCLPGRFECKVDWQVFYWAAESAKVHMKEWVKCLKWQRVMEKCEQHVSDNCFALEYSKKVQIWEMECVGGADSQVWDLADGSSTYTEQHEGYLQCWVVLLLNLTKD